MTDAALLELRRIAVLVEAQGALIVDLQLQLLGKADRRKGLRLVPAIGRIVGDGRPFDVATLAAMVLNDRSPSAGVIRDAMSEHTDADGGFRSFGWLLGRLANVPLGGWRVQRAAGERWRVRAGFPVE
jgi:hypothetical protein